MAKKTRASKKGKTESEKSTTETVEKTEELLKTTTEPELPSETEPEVGEVVEKTELKKKKEELPEESVTPGPQKIALQDACRRYIANYKEPWYQSIKKFASSQGFVDPATPEECQSLLRRWGAKLK